MTNSRPFHRLFEAPNKTFFLFGPRGTGKTSWLQSKLTGPGATWIDLLKPSTLMAYQREPELLEKVTAATTPKSWVIIDEVQRLPALLDVVQGIITRNKNARFALTGSSARKLKSGGANLLAGRALTKNFYPLNALEMGDQFRMEQALKYGTLPEVVNAATDEEREEYLDAYVLTYLTIEIQQEALVRKLETFRRFLTVASVLDGQIANLSGISREVGLGRSTVQGYFEVVVDTLLGSFLPSFRPRAKVKEVEHPKFYFFDPGVSRALTGEHRNPLSPEAKGHALENFMIGQIRALDSYLRVGGQFSYWRTESGTEVDLVWSRGTKAIGFEIKSSTRWRPEYGRGLRTLAHEKKISKGFGVYLGKERLRSDGVEVYPAVELLQAIGKGMIHPA